MENKSEHGIRESYFFGGGKRSSMPPSKRGRATAEAEHTIEIIRRRAEEWGVPVFGELAEAKMRGGMARFGATSHLTQEQDWLQEALDELGDAWAYLAIAERRGGQIPEELWESLAATAGMMLELRNGGQDE